MSKKQRYVQPVPAESAGQTIKMKYKLTPKNDNQKAYLASLRSKPLTICNGPAGTGKTFIVTYVALEKLISNEVDKIVITRPIVQAGEDLGFLPGNLEEKIDPYLKPIIEAMESHIGSTMLKKLIEAGKIEMAPLAFMRGRTINKAFVILDETQNTTSEQIVMFVTRMGFNSVFAVNGDTSQTDLKKPRDAERGWCTGLEHAIRQLTGRDSDIDYIKFFGSDSVRNPLVTRALDYFSSPPSQHQQSNITAEEVLAA